MILNFLNFKWITADDFLERVFLVVVPLRIKSLAILS